MSKQDIKNFTLEELKVVIERLGRADYRAGQIFYWLYQKGVADFSEMSHLPKIFIEKLNEAYYIGQLKLQEHLKSGDGAEKLLFELSDGNFIETVLISAKERKTICLSSQVGCKFACPVCASGSRGFKRDLTPSEITGQILFLRDKLKQAITNYVFMGMGEPLDNFNNLKSALLIMNNPAGMDIGARRITISTCGIIPGIKRLAELALQVNLSVSLHAPDQKLRNELIPINKRYPLEELIKACQDYLLRTKKMITLEYLLIKGENISRQDAEKLAKIARLLKAKVNLIAYSEVLGKEFQSPEKAEIKAFMDRLRIKGVKATLRQSKGRDIQAACGQLAGKQANGKITG